MIPPRWSLVAPADPAATATLADALRIPTPLAALLVQRGFTAPEVARAFLRPELERLSDPSAWAGMGVAVELIVAAVRAGRGILVHGDYDVDGQCAAAMLTRILREAGASVHAFVPHRLRDGYDFGPAGLAEAQRVGAGLIITCDCGITAGPAVAAARAAGMEVIVTDHHIPAGRTVPPWTRTSAAPASPSSWPRRSSARSGCPRTCRSIFSTSSPSPPWPTWCPSPARTVSWCGTD
jgi:single-stranded-DNA-specific exonuclease